MASEVACNSATPASRRTGANRGMGSIIVEIVADLLQVLTKYPWAIAVTCRLRPN